MGGEACAGGQLRRRFQERQKPRLMARCPPLFAQPSRTVFQKPPTTRLRRKRPLRAPRRSPLFGELSGPRFLQFARGAEPLIERRICSTDCTMEIAHSRKPPSTGRIRAAGAPLRTCAPVPKAGRRRFRLSLLSPSAAPRACFPRRPSARCPCRIRERSSTF